MASKSGRRCRHITTADGTIVRMQVRTGMTDDELREEAETLLELARAITNGKCNEPSNVPLPKLAQREGNTTYRCGREKGHTGPHRWPAHDGSITEWTTPQPEEEQ